MDAKTLKEIADNLRDLRIKYTTAFDRSVKDIPVMEAVDGVMKGIIEAEDALRQVNRTIMPIQPRRAGRRI